MVAPTHAGTSTALWRATCGAVVAVVCLSAQQATNSAAKPWGVVGTEDNHSARGGGGGPPGGVPQPPPCQTRDKRFRSGAGTLTPAGTQSVERCHGERFPRSSSGSDRNHCLLHQ